jgi:predicted phosphodiesterase
LEQVSERPTPFAAFSCPHCPFENPESVDWLLGQLADLKPRPRYLFNLGDLFESDAASVWPQDHDHTLEDEYKHAARLQGRVREVVPYRCEYVWMLGNHDDNLQSNDRRRVPRALRPVIHWNIHKDWSKEFLRWKQVPYEKSKRGQVSLGQVTFTHGFDCGVNSDELEALQFHYIMGSTPHRLVVRGHTHRPTPITQCYRTKTVPLACYHVNVGTLGPLQPGYMSRKSAIMWGPGLVVGEATEDYDPLGGQQWSAELRTP